MLHGYRGSCTSRVRIYTLGPSVTCHSDPEGVVMVALNGLRLPQSAEVTDFNMRPLSNCWRDSDIELYKQWVGSS